MNATAARGLALETALLAMAARSAAQEGAQQPAPKPAPEAPGQESVSPAEPTKDLFDLLRELRHKPPPPAPGPRIGESARVLRDRGEARLGGGP